MAEMTTQDIVKNSDEVRDQNLDWKQVYTRLHNASASNKYRIFRTNNTLFLVKIMENNVGQVFTFNADAKNKLISNVLEFLKALKVAKYKIAILSTKDEQLFNSLKQNKFRVDIREQKDENNEVVFQGAIHV